MCYIVVKVIKNMKRKKKSRLTRLELEVMEPLWRLKSASIREIREGLPKNKRPEYTTVQTVIYRLEEKGAVARVKKIGNAHIFQPKINRKPAITNFIEDITNILSGSSRLIISHLIESGKITLDDLKYMEDLINETSKKGRK